MDTKTVLKRPILTEKSLRLAQLGQYTFEVDKRANKHHISNAVHQLFDVEVISVKTIRLKAKKRRVGRQRHEIEKRSWKKAIVVLKPDQKIDLFDTG